MEKVELIKLLRQKQADATSIINEESRELEFLKTFYQKYSLIGVDNMVKVDHTDLVLAYILAHISSDDREQAFMYIYNQVESIRNIINDCSETDIKIILTVLDRLRRDDYLPEAKILFEDANKKRGKFNMKKILLNGLLSENNLQALYDIQDQTGSNMANLISLYEDAEHVFETALLIICDLKNLREDTEDFHRALDDFGANSKERRFLISEFKDDFDTTEIDKDFHEIRKHYDSLAATDRSKKKTAQRELNVYRTLEEKLVNALNKDEITDIAKVLTKVPDEQIRLEVLKLVYEHNNEYYQRLLSEYEELSKNSSIHYQTLLKEYGVDEIEVETIMTNSVEDVKSILQKLRKVNITDKKVIKTILQITDIETFNNILDLVELGILSTKLLIDNSIMFDKASSEYEHLMVNMKMFKELGFNPNNLFDNQDIFITEPKLIAQSISILKQYKFTKGFKKNVDYSFLTLPNLMSILDQMLELGLEKFLEEDLSIINHYRRLNRIRIIRELNIPIDSKEELIELLTTDKFIVSDELIPNYLQKVSNKEVTEFVETSSVEDDINALKQYETTPRTYNINGVLISINRVKRNYSEFNKNSLSGNRLLYSVFNDSHLTKSNYRTIKETLTESLTYK